MSTMEAAGPIDGLAPHEQADWLPQDAEHLPTWLREVGDAHRKAVAELDEAIMAVVALQHELDESARTWRRSLREATALGKPAPKRPFDADEAKAQIEVAQEDATAARDSVAEVVLVALAELRPPERRQEVEPFWNQLSPALRLSLRTGPRGWVEGIKSDLRARLDELGKQAAGGEVESIDESAPLHEEGNRAVI